MKKIVTLAIALSGLLHYGSNAQTVISSCTGPDSVINKCKYNASELAVRTSYSNNTAYKDSIAIDPMKRDTFLRAIVAIYNATSLPVRDTIINYRHIGAYPTTGISDLDIVCDTSQQWAKNLVNSIIPCGYHRIDSLLNTYHLSVFSASGNMVSLQTDSDYFNMPKMVALFQTIPGIQYAAIPAVQNWGDDVTATITPTFVNVVYRYNFLRYWKFHVYYDCKVEYVSTWKEPDTDPSGINELSSQSVQLYPNPTKLSLSIKMDQNIRLSGFSIYSPDGKLVSSGSLQNTNTINVQNLSPGLYFLNLSSDKGIGVLKFIKE
ncbi:T9SS type A sorting domain-containing protein [Rurimicrobium arvi]|uniref:Secretion system C-terminal sorting domain-containing protein n=1 Tax=Rurimicrobium arvi TaxID=2049916 RepID=A0ABP8MYL4_9BACT